MKGSDIVTAHLNTVLGVELAEINQYFLHARMLKNWGFRALGKAAYDDSIAAMKEADRSIERLLFLEAKPSMQIGRLTIGNDVPEILRSDLALELRARADLVKAIAACETEADYVSRDLLSHHLEETEERIDFHETQIDLIAKVGLENYQQSAIGEFDAGGA